MTVAELITELQKMPPDALVTMWINPEANVDVNIHWVEKRSGDRVYLNDKYWTPYAEED